MLLMFFTGICFVPSYLSQFYQDFLPHGADSVVPDAPTLRHVAQSSSRQVQIGQRTQHKQDMSILGRAAVTNLGKAEQPLDHSKYMLHLGSDFRPGAVARLGRRVQRLIAQAFSWVKSCAESAVRRIASARPV